MVYYDCYSTPDGLDDLLLKSDGKKLIGVSFIVHYDGMVSDLPVFTKTRSWLDSYFNGKPKPFDVPYCLDNVTPFQKRVLTLLLDIPYGETRSYKDIARAYMEKYHVRNMSCQAIGQAVGSNPICIVIPCHRVINNNGRLGGYAYGLRNKMKLLEIEKVGRR
jgi:methylated-DNA-[protein]-cysteine S-methyltransferase